MLTTSRGHASHQGATGLASTPKRRALGAASPAVGSAAGVSPRGGGAARLELRPFSDRPSSERARKVGARKAGDGTDGMDGEARPREQERGDKEERGSATAQSGIRSGTALRSLSSASTNAPPLAVRQLKQPLKQPTEPVEKPAPLMGASSMAATLATSLLHPSGAWRPPAPMQQGARGGHSTLPEDELDVD